MSLWKGEGRQHFTFDADLLLKDAGAITATADGTVGGVGQIIEVGTGRVNGNLVVDIASLDIASNDEKYSVVLYGSTSATFASVIVPLLIMEFGAAAAIRGDVSTVVGRYVLPFTNVLGDVAYPYVKVACEIAGTTPSIDYTAWLTKPYPG